ncbi:MAG: hypothetical protein H7296_02380 [Bacteroidia bacterium]|nr:hypothetical protein [Bacteroidia bacterium]
MKIAIQTSLDSFSDRWIQYCLDKKIPFKLVDCYRNDIIEQLQDCDAFMWHPNHSSSKDFLFSKQLIFSLEATGKVVFPNYNTVWHFDDKVGQKYLLESHGIDLVKTHVFYDKKDALKWIGTTSFPKVFKLRCGAGSANVRLVLSHSKAKSLINKAFDSGFSQYNAWSNLLERIRKYKNGKATLVDIGKGLLRFVYPPKFAKYAGKERGYIYFQEFIPNNNCDIRIIVIDGKAFAIKRMVRENDFRASGSGFIKYEKENFDESTIKLSFEIARKLNSDCLAIDFVYKNDKPYVIEISYGYVKQVYYPCVGYWDMEMNFFEGSFNSQAWMVDLIVKNIKEKNIIK